jgi:hypothetical protein
MMVVLFLLCMMGGPERSEDVAVSTVIVENSVRCTQRVAPRCKNVALFFKHEPSAIINAFEKKLISVGYLFTQLLYPTNVNNRTNHFDDFGIN